MIPYAGADLDSFRAISHPLRVRILAVLGDRSLTAAELAKIVEVDERTASSHARTLERLGYVSSTRDPRRGTRRYHLVAGVEVRDEVWSRAPTTAKREHIGAGLAQLRIAAEAALGEGGFDRGDIHLTRTVVDVDEQGWAELAGEMLRWLGRIDEIGRVSAERLAGSGEEPLHATAGLLLFESAKARPQQHEPGAVPEQEFTEEEGLEVAFRLNEQLEELLVRPKPPLEEVVALIDQLRVVARAVMAQQDAAAMPPVDRDD